MLAAVRGPADAQVILCHVAIAAVSLCFAESALHPLHGGTVEVIVGHAFLPKKNGFSRFASGFFHWPIPLISPLTGPLIDRLH